MTAKSGEALELNSLKGTSTQHTQISAYMCECVCVCEGVLDVCVSVCIAYIYINVCELRPIAVVESLAGCGNFGCIIKQFDIK